MPVNSSVTARRLLLYTMFTCSFALLSVERIAAQVPCYMQNVPNTESGKDPRTPEQIEKAVLECLAQFNKQIENDPADAAVFEARGDHYAVLYGLSEQRRSINESYAEKGLADFSAAVQLKPKASTFAARANLHQLIWLYRTYQFSSMNVPQQLEHLLRSPNFESAVSDYLQAIRLSDIESETNQYFINLSSHLYFRRSEVVVYHPELLKALSLRGEKYSVWEDFVTALEYVAKAGFSGMGVLNDIYKKKVDWAYKRGRYDIALATLQSDEKYFGQEYNLLCDENSVWSCADLKKGQWRDLSLWKAKVYLKLKQPEKALAALDVYFANPYLYECPLPFRLRAEAYRMLGNTKEALADEQKAWSIPSKGVCQWEGNSNIILLR